MSRHRIIRAAALTAMVLCLQAASASASSTLLSGYGGPGQGNQAIIGSTLIGGEGGGNSGGGGAAQSAAPAAGAAAPASIALPQAPPARSGKAVRRPGAGRRARHEAPARSPSGTGSTRRPAPSAARSGGGGTLGLSGADLLYVLLAFCLLAATALLTARLSGRTLRAPGTRPRQEGG